MSAGLSRSMALACLAVLAGCGDATHPTFREDAPQGCEHLRAGDMVVLPNSERATFLGWESLPTDSPLQSRARVQARGYGDHFNAKCEDLK